MTMFSMKPKFNLEEFLSVPATAGASRHRNARYRTAKAAPETAADEDTAETKNDDTVAD